MSIRATRSGDILSLFLDRPDADNRIDETIVKELAARLEEVDPLEGGPAVVVLGATGANFSLGRQRPAVQSADPLKIVEEFSLIQRVNEAVQRCRAVTIASVRGRAEGAGLSLAARCDIVIVADDAALSFPEIQHGIPPTIVLSHYRYILPRNLLGDLIFTGRQLAGRDAVAAGLAARAVPADDLDAVTAEVAHRVAGYDRRSIALVKTFLAETEDLAPGRAPRLGISLYANEMSHRLLDAARG